MEAVHINNNSSLPALQKAMVAFFRRNSPDSVQLLFWKLFQCWVTKDCALKSGTPDEEVALVFDQLAELVSAAYLVHQASRLPPDVTEGKRHA